MAMKRSLAILFLTQSNLFQLMMVSSNKNFQWMRRQQIYLSIIPQIELSL